MSLLSGRLKTKELLRFCHSMAASLHAGLPIVRAIRLFDKKSYKLHNLITGLRESLETGCTFEDALRAEHRYLPAYLVEILAAAERSGRLVYAFRALSAYIEENLRLQYALWRQLAYPLVVLVAAVFVIPFVQGFVLANMGGNDTGMLDYTRRFLLGWASPVFYLTVFIYLWRFGVFRPVTDRISVDIPFIAVYTRRLALAKFLWTLSILLDSTVPLPEAIQRAARATGSRVLERDFLPAAVHVQHGATFAQAFATSRYLSPMMRDMIAVGDTAGSLPELLRKASEYTLGEANHLVRMGIRLVQAVCIVLIAFRFF